MSGASVVMRPALLLRVWAIAIELLSLVIGAELLTSVIRSGVFVVLIPLMAIAAATAAIFYGVNRVSVRLRQDELVVQLPFTTRRIRRDDVLAFVGGPDPNRPLDRTIYITLANGEVVSLAMIGRAYPLARGRRVLRQRLIDLEKWRVAAPW